MPTQLHQGRNSSPALQACRHATATRLGECGFSVVEVVIAALVLVITTSVGVQLFNDYLASTENARIRDSLSSLIVRDIEAMRYHASRLWSCSAATYQNQPDCLIAANQGGLTSAYTPPSQNCLSQTLAAAAAAEDDQFRSGSSNLSVDATTARSLRQAIPTRTIQHHGNIIAISYFVASPFGLHHIAYITPNALAWCSP